MKTLFKQMDDIKIEYENIEIDVHDKTATADMDVLILAKMGNDTGYILGDLSEPAHLTFTLEKERTTWLVIKTEGLHRPILPKDTSRFDFLNNRLFRNSYRILRGN